MRDTKELLQVMLEHQDLFVSGLCEWTNHLYRRGRITYDEADELKIYINKHRPSMFSSIDAFKHRNKDYFWTWGDITPRIKWIEKHLAK